jgi:hypothetical protein
MFATIRLWLVGGCLILRSAGDLESTSEKYQSAYRIIFLVARLPCERRAVPAPRWREVGFRFEPVYLRHSDYLLLYYIHCTRPDVSCNAFTQRSNFRMVLQMALCPGGIDANTCM